jgi:hypothetical protein
MKIGDAGEMLTLMPDSLGWTMARASQIIAKKPVRRWYADSCEGKTLLGQGSWREFDGGLSISSTARL